MVRPGLGGCPPDDAAGQGEGVEVRQVVDVGVVVVLAVVVDPTKHQDAVVGQQGAAVPRPLHLPACPTQESELIGS